MVEKTSTGQGIKKNNGRGEKRKARRSKKTGKGSKDRHREVKRQARWWKKQAQGGGAKIKATGFKRGKHDCKERQASGCKKFR